MKQINSLNDDIQATNGIRKFRKSIGSTQQTRYPYCWWKTFLATLTKAIEPMVAGDVEKAIDNLFGMKFNISTNQIRIINAVNGQSPHYVHREYAKSLPSIVKATGLKYRKATQAEYIENGNNGRPAKYLFYFQDPVHARNVLLTNFTDMLALFVELDREFNPQ